MSSSAASVPRFASLYKNLKPSAVARSAYTQRLNAKKAAESAIASRLVDIMAMKAHEAACKNAQSQVYEYDNCDYEDYIDYIYENDW